MARVREKFVGALKASGGRQVKSAGDKPAISTRCAAFAPRRNAGVRPP